MADTLTLPLLRNGSLPFPRCGRGLLRGAVADAALMLGAMGAAIHLAAGLDAMADDLAAAMGASGRHRVDRAFEAVEGHRTAGIRHLECLIVIVAADIACRHRGS